MKKLRLLWSKIKNNLPTLLVTAFLITIYLVLMTNLGRDYLFDWDEGIYGELGRQLTLRRDLFTTYWNGEPWFEKPPGVAWIAGLGIALAGDSAYGARLLFPLVAIYTLWITYLLGKKIGDWRTGLVAAGLLATFNLFLGRTRSVNTDMPLLASLATTILFLLEKRPSWWVALSIVAGVWFKGIAGLISVIVALPLVLAKQKTYIIRLILTFLALVTPWHLYMLLRYGNSFLTPYFYEQVLTRTTTQIEFHFESRWYYFTYLYENLGLGVLTVVGVGVILLLKHSLADSKNRLKYLTILWWILAPLSIFTLAKTRLFWYILPIYPALSLTAAYAITRIVVNDRTKVILNILAVGVLLQGIMIARTSVEVDKVVVPMPDRLQIAHTIQGDAKLLVLVPRSERLAEALLPDVARLSSSFRYGGMPSLVYYYHGPVEFFYNVDTFNELGLLHPAWMLVSREDLSLLTFPYKITAETKEYLGIKRSELYADR